MASANMGVINEVVQDEQNVSAEEAEVRRNIEDLYQKINDLAQTYPDCQGIAMIILSKNSTMNGVCGRLGIRELALLFNGTESLKEYIAEMATQDILARIKTTK